MESILSFEPHPARISAFKLFGRHGFEQYCITSAADCSTKVWNFPHLLNPDIEIKKPAAVCATKQDVVTALETFDTLMGLPVFGMGTSAGLMKMCAIYPSSRTKDMTMGTWEAHPGGSVVQIAALPDLKVYSSMSGSAVRVWRYRIGDDGVCNEMVADLGSVWLKEKCGSDSPVSMQWAVPGAHLCVSFGDTATIACLDVETGTVLRSFETRALADRKAEETRALK